MACILLWSSAVRVHDSQAYRKMDVTRERISRILDRKHLFFSLSLTFSDVNINKYMLQQSQCSLADSLLFCVFSLSFKWSAHHILSKTNLSLTPWHYKIHMGCFTNLDGTSSQNYVWTVPNLWSTLDFTWPLHCLQIFCHKFQVNPINVLFCW